MSAHKGIDTPSGRVDTYRDGQSGHTNYVQGGQSGGHTHSDPQSGHFDVTHGDGSKSDMSGAKGSSLNLGGGIDRANSLGSSGGGSGGGSGK